MSKLSVAKLIMFLAAIYNLVWGAIISTDPQLILFGYPETPFVLILIRCIGMLVGVYGVAYYFASKDPCATGR